MPPRKSDTGRKSDASTIAVAEKPSEASPSATEEASTQNAAASAEPSSTGKAEKKDKDKEKDKEKDHDKTTIEDLTLPRSIITRLAKGVLPQNTQVQANAILAMSKSTTVFINYLAAHANEITMNANKKTIAPADVFKALDEIEFGFLKEPLEAEFAKYNAIQTEKRNTYRAKVKKPATGTTKDGDDADTDMANSSMQPDTSLNASTTGAESTTPPAKKARVDAANGAGEETEEEPDAEDDEEEDVQEEDDDEEGGEGEGDEEEEEAEEEEGQESGDETQDALEERASRDDVEPDEALDGDESD